MKLGGQPNRVELKPETEAEKEALQRIIDGNVAIFWGDSEFKGGALILNSGTVAEAAMQKLRGKRR